MDDPHVYLHDAVALAEIDLYTDVLAAVSEADAPLTTEELDRVLGLLPPAAVPSRPVSCARSACPGAPGLPV